MLMTDVQYIAYESDVEEQTERPQKKFAVDARTVLQLGRQSIKDNATAVLELVKNSYDADADVVEVEIYSHKGDGYIRVADNGVGMTEDVIDNAWLRIGFSAKREDTISKRNRRKTGEKGVGRISVDKLGSTLELRTKAVGHQEIGLVIDWNLFDVEGKDVSEVPVTMLQDVEVNLPRQTEGTASSGTELIIRGLRDQWTPEEVRELYEELSVLTPPFEQVQDFKIILSTDITTDYKGLVTSPFQEAALIELKADFDGETLHYDLLDRSDSAVPFTQSAAINWKQLVQRVTPGRSVREQAMIGPVGLKLLFYLRSQTSVLSESGIQLANLRDFLDRNAGVKVYRDNIRVRPYGDPATPDGDWLGLNRRRVQDPAGLNRITYHFNANQVVGAVFLGRDINPELVDSASREGLLHGPAFDDMRALTLSCLSLMEMHRIQVNQRSPSNQEQSPPGKVLSNFTEELSSLQHDLAQAQDNLLVTPYADSEEMKRILDRVSIVAEKGMAANASLNDLMSEAGILRGLATLGIAASVFGHETQSALSQFLSSTALVRDLLHQEPLDRQVTEEELEKALRYARQVSSWGAFSLARVKRSKREKRTINVKETICQLVKGVQPAFQSASIRIEADHLEDVSANLFEMDIEAIVINLMTNAYVACQQPQGVRRVRIELLKTVYDEKNGFDLVVSDSGPGVSEHLAEKIWKPLVTFKKDERGNEQGTGLGLTIVSSIVSESGGRKAVSRSLDLGGARFVISLPID